MVPSIKLEDRIDELEAENETLQVKSTQAWTSSNRRTTERGERLARAWGLCWRKEAHKITIDG